MYVYMCTTDVIVTLAVVLHIYIPRDILVALHKEKHSSNPITANENRLYNNMEPTATLFLHTWRGSQKITASDDY